MASGIYNCFKEDLFLKQVNLGTGGDTIKVALLSGGHSFSATNDVWSDISINQITGTGYTMSGATLGSQSVTSGATLKFDGADTAWTTASFTASHAALYDSTNSNSLICSIDFGGAKTVSSGTFTIQWDSDGIITLT